MRVLARLLVVLLLASTASASPDTAAVRDAMNTFLAALNRLDVDAMSACFTEDVTAFVPAAQADRVNGRAALTAIFRNFVEKTKPTVARLNIVPEDLQAEASGGLGVVTFNVRESGVTRRRTFVFRRGADGKWLISHMHASDFFAAPKS